ncbi:type I secretion system permease/ATPase [Defluviimonas sp. WL0002]|uniref:Type I secretion system permease/ATPase n=1 Tax=Albidovulum marisflavi TaxID=2984159 RepID=A0ABT2ZBZ6_9RHOB|nr:type I secretion system permease/ATPase [Defluviimonas sp. WL0002]MCV2868665.1 type I secretion system permease/ATPase [Defluviimonas sp. WL0002]
MPETSKDARLDKTMGAVRRLFPALVVLSFLVNLLLLVSALYMLQVYDRVLSSGSLDTLAWLTVGALAALVIYGVLEYARKVILGRAAYWLEIELSAPVIRRALAGRLAGEGPKASVTDVADLRSFVGGDAMLAFLDAPWSPIFLAFIWLVHPVLGMIAVGGAVVLFVLAVINDFVTRKPQQQVGAELRRSHATAQQYVDGAETVSPLGMAETLLSHWQNRYEAARSVQTRLGERTFAILSGSRSVRLALQVMILGAGAYQVLAGQLTAGGMVAAAIILSRALAPIERSIGAWRGFVAARAAYRNLKAAFARNDVPEGSLTLPRPAGRLSVENVFCLAPQSSSLILEDINFAIEPGQVCGVVGPSGSGKTSLCRLLVGAWRPVRGHVRLDGADVSAWNPEELGPYLGYLPQEVELFPATVAQNIARMRDVDSETVIMAARLAGVHEMILRLPSGYDTDVGLHGGRLSGGQRQRLGLARALFGDPALVVLDEPNSNLDSNGEQALMAAIGHLKARGTTIVMVTHNAAVLRATDKILALREGKVAAFDDRDQILRIGRGEQPKPGGKRVGKLRPAE